MAIEHDSIADGERHEPKGISTAAANQVYVSNGAGSGSWKNQVGGANTVNVSDASDLPSPISGEINLVDDITYIISGTVTISDTIVPGSNNSIVGLEASNNRLVYTGTGSMFKGRDTGLYLTNIGISCATGTLNDWQDISPKKTSVVEYSSCIIEEAKNLGLCTDIKQLRYFACVFSDIKTTGHTFAGDFQQIFSVDTDYVNNSATPVYDLGTATTDLMWHLDYQADLANASGSFISGLANSGNINAGGSGQLLLGLFLGTGTPLVNIDKDDLRWAFTNNTIIPDTDPSALIFMKDNATATTISTANTPVLIAGTFTEQEASFFTTTAGGRITYVGDKDRTVSVRATMTAQVAGGADKKCTYYLAKNGTVITNSGMSDNIKGSAVRNTSLLWRVDVTTNDYLELFVENNADTNDITVEDVNFVIN